MLSTSHRAQGMESGDSQSIAAESREPVCSVCRRRPAVYHRTYSGELLCKKCLLRALARSVKKQAGASSVFRPRMRVLVPVSLWAPHLGLALAAALAEATRKLDVDIHLAVPAGRKWSVDVGWEVLVRLKSMGVSGFWRARVELAGGLPRTLRGCMRLDRAWTAIAARELGADAVGLPVTRTAAILALLDALLSGEPWGVSDAIEDAVYVRGVPEAPLFYNVESEAAAALAAVYGLYAWPPCKPRSLGTKAFSSIARGRPELEFSVHKTLRLLADSISTRDGYCPSCGGLSPDGGLCPYCRAIGLRDVVVEPLTV